MVAGVIVAGVTALSCRGQTGSLVVEFPDVKNWDKSPPRDLPKASGGGYSVGYNSTGRTAATFYVYNRGLAKLPADLGAAEVVREWDSVRNMLFEAKKLGIYQAVDELENKKSTLGQRKEARDALYARYTIVLQGTKSASEMYLFTHKNHFIKVRVTTPLPEAAAEREKIGELLQALERAVVRAEVK